MDLLQDDFNAELNTAWEERSYRGKRIGFETSGFVAEPGFYRYPEHDDAYMQECIRLLFDRGENIVGKLTFLDQEGDRGNN